MTSRGLEAAPAAAFERLDRGAFRASTLTRGPWHPDHQHAGPPIALVAGEIARTAAALELTHVARLTANLLRPIPIAELSVEVQTDYVSRNAAHFSARLLGGSKELARFTALVQREAAIDAPDELPGHPLPLAPRPVEDSQPARFPFNRTMTGYQDLIESRLAQGSFFSGPSAVWFRLRHPLVAGEMPTGIQRTAVAADSGNGISAVLDWNRYVFVNFDLTLNLLRPACGEWICVDACTLLGPSGGGLTESRLFDAEGLIGRATQSLSIRRRD